MCLILYLAADEEIGPAKVAIRNWSVSRRPWQHRTLQRSASAIHLAQLITDKGCWCELEREETEAFSQEELALVACLQEQVQAVADKHSARVVLCWAGDEALLRGAEPIGVAHLTEPRMFNQVAGSPRFHRILRQAS